MFIRVNGQEIALDSIQDVWYYEEKYTNTPCANITLKDGEVSKVRGSEAVGSLRQIIQPHVVIDIKDDDQEAE